MTTSGHTQMTASTPEKFLFDNDFDALDTRREAKAPSGDEHADEDATHDAIGDVGQDADAGEHGLGEHDLGLDDAEANAPPPPSYTEADLEQAREEGRVAGRDEATKDMAGAIEQRTAETLNAINTQLVNMFDTYNQDREQHSRDAVAVATVIMRKLFPALNMDKAMAEIEHMITEAMKRTSGNPMLMVRVAPDMAEDVETRAAALAALRGREGSVNVIADPDVAVGDARVEWEGGGMLRDSAFIWNEIDDIIERNLGQKVEMPPERGPDTDEARVENTAPVEENEEFAAESAPATPAGPESNEADATDAAPADPADAPENETPDGARPEDGAPQD